MTTTTQNGSERTASQPVRLGSLLPQESTMESSLNRNCVALCVSDEPIVRHEPNKIRTREEIPEAMRRGIRNVARGLAPWPLFMWGPPGTGKTCAALMLLDYCNGLTQYWAVEQLCEHLISCDQGQVFTEGMRQATVTRRSTWRDVKEAQIVVLDEIGGRLKEVSDHHHETVKRVLDLREGSPLIVISNLRISELSAIYGDRVPSRAAAGSILDWREYPDRRITHHAKENTNGKS